MQTKPIEASLNVNKPTEGFIPSDIVRIGKSIYVIERHFVGNRDIRDAIYAAVKSEAFRAS